MSCSFVLSEFTRAFTDSGAGEFRKTHHPIPSTGDDVSVTRVWHKLCLQSRYWAILCSVFHTKAPFKRDLQYYQGRKSSAKLHLLYQFPAFQPNILLWYNHIHLNFTKISKVFLIFYLKDIAPVSAVKYNVWFVIFPSPQHNIQVIWPTREQCTF